jgi:lysozyme
MITIGYGHAEPASTTNKVAGETRITQETAEKLLKEDVQNAADGLNRLLQRWKKAGVEYDITQGMYDAMVSMIYNAGIGNFLKSKFIQYVKNKEYDKAADEILNFYVTYPGHVKRRKKEYNLFIS